VRADHRRNRRGRRLRAAGSRRGGKTAKDGRIAFNFGSVFQKEQHIGTGQCPVKRYNEFLRDLIVAGKATPSLLGSHEVALDDAPAAYEKFDKRENGWTKVLLHPTGNVSSHGAAR
jgi:threonine dehydrogenase-like Zn-dependent dehydrogenase